MKLVGFASRLGHLRVVGSHGPSRAVETVGRFLGLEVFHFGVYDPGHGGDCLILPLGEGLPPSLWKEDGVWDYLPHAITPRG